MHPPTHRCMALNILGGMLGGAFLPKFSAPQATKLYVKVRLVQKWYGPLLSSWQVWLDSELCRPGGGGEKFDVLFVCPSRFFDGQTIKPFEFRNGFGVIA